MRKLICASSILFFWLMFLSCKNPTDTPIENPSVDAADPTGVNDSLFYIIDEAFEKPIGQSTISFLKTITPENVPYNNNSLYSFEKDREVKLCWIANDIDKTRKYAIIIFDSDGNRLYKHLSSFTTNDGIQSAKFTPHFSFDGLVSFWQLKKKSGRDRYRSMGTEPESPDDVCPKNAEGSLMYNLIPPAGRKTISSTKSDGGTVVVTMDDR